MDKNKPNFKVMVLTESGELSTRPDIVNYQGSVEDQAWQTEMDKLRRYNLICGTLHLVQGIIIYSLAVFNDDIGAVTLPITSLF